MMTCYAFGSVPPFAQGLVRDLRVRWALEEAGLPYRVQLVGDRPGEMRREAYNALQPFGQIPLLEDGDMRLFESGAIVLYVAERSPVLLPTRQPDRAHVIQWMFAALNTIELGSCGSRSSTCSTPTSSGRRTSGRARSSSCGSASASSPPCLGGRDTGRRVLRRRHPDVPRAEVPPAHGPAEGAACLVAYRSGARRGRLTEGAR